MVKEDFLFCSDKVKEEIISLYSILDTLETVKYADVWVQLNAALGAIRKAQELIR